METMNDFLIYSRNENTQLLEELFACTSPPDSGKTGSQLVTREVNWSLSCLMLSVKDDNAIACHDHVEPKVE